MPAGGVEAWYMCAGPWADIRAENRCMPNSAVSMAKLSSLGVKHWYVDAVPYEYPTKAMPFQADKHHKVDPALAKLRAEYGMNYADIITITPEHMPGYHDKLKSFFEEHIHDDDEIRYILSGQGYFDVRDCNDDWIRIQCKGGDIITLPEGIYHRFTLDTSDYVQAMRLFIGDPVWTPLNRPQEGHAKRAAYVSRYFEAPAADYLCSLMAEYFKHGWCYGTSGGMSLKVSPKDPKSLVLAAPSGVPKERLTADLLFRCDAAGAVVTAPAGLKPSDSNEVHFAIYAARKASCGAIIHTHSKAAALATALAPPGADVLTFEPCEMAKGLGATNTQVLSVPLIPNMPKEPMLVPALQAALSAHPSAVAVLVRSHGLYAWGADWDAAKRHTEILEYLLDLQVQRAAVGLPPPPPLPHANGAANGATNGATSGVYVNGTGEPAAKRPRLAAGPGAVPPSRAARAIVLDVEGTTTPITFVKEVLYGYFTKQVADWSAFRAKYAGDAAVDAACEAVRAQVLADGEKSVREDLGSYLKQWVAEDRKVSALKTLQGLVWNGGYATGELKGQMFDDVPGAMASWKAAAKQVYIFSSGSRAAQRAIYAHSERGDLTPNLSGYFEPASVGGHSKRAAKAYHQIALSIGRDPQDILFATDIYEEALAAREAGWNAAIVVRPGNAPLCADAKNFLTITSLADL